MWQMLEIWSGVCSQRLCIAQSLEEDESKTRKQIHRHNNVSAMQDIKENAITEKETVGYFKKHHQDRLH